MQDQISPIFHIKPKKVMDSCA